MFFIYETLIYLAMFTIGFSRDDEHGSERRSH